MKNIFVSDSLTSTLKFVFLLFVLELFAFGSGVHFSYGWITPRKILFLLFSVLALVDFVRRGRASYKIICLVVAWGAYFYFWVLFLWFVDAERPLDYGVRDALPLIGVIVFYISWQVLSRTENWSYIRNWMAIVIFLYALVHVAIFCVGLYSVDMALMMGDVMKSFMEPAGYDVEGSVFIHMMGPVVRVYFVGSCMLLVGVYFGTALYKDCSIKRLVYLAIVLMALFSTLTRSFMVSIFLYCFGCYIFHYVFKLVRPTPLVVFFLLSIPFVLSLLMMVVINPGFLSYIGFARDISDDLRYDQFGPLVDAFLNSPVIGSGFGLVVNPIRNVEAPFSYELSILSLFTKIGVVGFLLAIVIVTLTIVILFKKDRFPCGASRLYSLYLSLVVATYFNPYLFSFYGTMFFLFVLYEYAYLSHKSTVLAYG